MFGSVTEHHDVAVEQTSLGHWPTGSGPCGERECFENNLFYLSGHQGQSECRADDGIRATKLVEVKGSQRSGGGGDPHPRESAFNVLIFGEDTPCPPSLPSTAPA